MLFTAMVVELVNDVQDGRRDASAGQLLRAATPFLGPLIGVGLVASIAIVIGLFVFVIPGLILITVWSVFVPVIVLERAPGLSSLRRSRELVRGNGWQVFAVLLVLFVLVGVLSLALDGAAASAGTAAGIVVRVVLGVLTAPFSALASAVLYFQLRELSATVPGPDAPAGAGAPASDAPAGTGAPAPGAPAGTGAPASGAPAGTGAPASEPRTGPPASEPRTGPPASDPGTGPQPADAGDAFGRPAARRRRRTPATRSAVPERVAPPAPARGCPARAIGSTGDGRERSVRAAAQGPAARAHDPARPRRGGQGRGARAGHRRVLRGARRGGVRLHARAR